MSNLLTGCVNAHVYTTGFHSICRKHPEYSSRPAALCMNWLHILVLKLYTCPNGSCLNAFAGLVTFSERQYRPSHLLRSCLYSSPPPAPAPSVTPSDTVVRRSFSQQSSSVSITIDDPIRTTRQLSPPHGKVSNIIHVTNLVSSTPNRRIKSWNCSQAAFHLFSGSLMFPNGVRLLCFFSLSNGALCGDARGKQHQRHSCNSDSEIPSRLLRL